MRDDRMRRRRFVALAGGATAAYLLPARGLWGQPAPIVRRVATLMARRETDPEGQKQIEALRQGLRDLGWAFDKTIQMDVRWTDGDPANALKYASDLMTLKPEILVANGTPSLVAMRKATTTIPIVFVGVADPVNQGFVPSLARPGGNITGFSVEEPSLGGKWLELLKEVAPQLTHVSVMVNPDTAPYAPMFMPTMQDAANAIRLVPSPVRNAAEIEQVIDQTAREPNGGLIVLPDSFLFAQRTTIIAAAARRRLPSIYPIQFFAIDGGLIAYGIDRVDLFYRAASYVDRILKGGSPAELPVQQPIKFQLAINLNTAKTLGLTVPRSLILSADEVIE